MGRTSNHDRNSNRKITIKLFTLCTMKSSMGERIMMAFIKTVLKDATKKTTVSLKVEPYFTPPSSPGYTSYL